MLEDWSLATYNMCDNLIIHVSNLKIIKKRDNDWINSMKNFFYKFRKLFILITELCRPHCVNPILLIIYNCSLIVHIGKLRFTLHWTICDSRTKENMLRHKRIIDCTINCLLDHSILSLCNHLGNHCKIIGNVSRNLTVIFAKVIRKRLILFRIL